MCRSDKIVDVSLTEEEEMEYDLDMVHGWISNEAVDRARSSLRRFLTQLKRTSIENELVSIPSSDYALSRKRRRAEEDASAPDLSTDAPLVFRHPCEK